LILEQDPRGSMVVQVHKHICDEVLLNVQTWSEWGKKTRAANVSRFCERRCAEVLLFDCTTQLPSVYAQHFFRLCFKTSINPKGCKRPQILAKTMSINKHSKPRLNLWEVWCIIALNIGKVLERLYYFLKVKCAISGTKQNCNLFVWKAWLV